MKNAMILLGLWIGIILAAYALVFVDGGGPTPAQIALLERVADRTIVDAEGRFQFEAPRGWRVTRTDFGVHLVDPLERIQAWVVAIDDMAAPRAIEIACGLTNPCPRKELQAFEDERPPEFAERKVRITYETDAEGEFFYGIGFVRIGETIVLLVRGDRAACEERIEDLSALEASLVAPATEAVLEEALQQPEAAPLQEPAG
ncbi:hypothetical protein ACFLTM_00290 [Candidatus Bipolaricaulota bacterium]